MDEKSCKNISVYDVSHKTLIGAKPLCVIYDRFDGFIKDYDRTK